MVHFEDGSETGEVVEAQAENGTVSFEADGFSIYAVVESTKRLVYNFYNGSENVATEYVKSGENLYDPGLVSEYGQTFIGWAYAPNETDETKIYNIDQLNADLATKLNGDFEDLDEVNVYAVFRNAYYLRYMTQDKDGNVVILKTVTKRTDAADKSYTIDYTPDMSEGEIFRGWTDVSTGQTYQAGTDLTLDKHIDLYLKVDGRNWLVFDANAGGPGSGATYTPPQLLIGDDVTKQPDDPVWKGYEFQGWYTNAEGTGSPFTFGSTLSQDTVLYAKWEPIETEYYVIFWQQKTSDGVGIADSAKSYDYVSSVKRTALTGSTVNIVTANSGTTADNRKGGFVGSDYGYYFTYNATNSDTDGKTVNADGSTVLNVYYDRRPITISFTSTNGSFPVTTYTGVVDGRTVTLTKQADGTYTYEKVNETINTYGWRYNDGRSTYNLPSTYINGTFYSDKGNDGEPNTGTASPYTQYNLPPDDDNTQYYCYDTYDRKFYEIQKYITGSTTSYITEVYDGEVTTSSSDATSYTLTGLYGAPLTTWPSAGDNYCWFYQTGTDRWGNPQGSYYLGRLTTFEIPSGFNSSKTETSLALNRQSYSASQDVISTAMDVEGKYSEIGNFGTFGLNGDGLTLNPEKYEGFVGDYWTWGTNSGAFNTTGTTSATKGGSGDQDCYVYYRRLQHDIHFISEGSNVTERSEEIKSGIYFEAPISSYAEGGANYYEPDNGRDGYYFAGWYSDAGCTVPFDFTQTMPNHDLTAYAKWDTQRVRVVLVPTPDNAHNDEVQLANNQSLTFRLDYKEKVSDENIKAGIAKRLGYKLVGWYTSPTFENDTLWNFGTEVSKEVAAVDMTYQQSADWEKYGDNDGAHDNVRGILKLYAKWVLDVDENSIYIEYDVDDEYRTYDSAGNLQTTIPVDTNAYVVPETGSVNANIAEAPTEYADGFEFAQWRLLNPDGSASYKTFKPGDAWEIDPEYVEERTITDDEGNTATIKVIRIKAEFSVDENNKATMVTFDGNGGVTNDSAAQESVTEAMTVNKTFYMKDAESFVREGYTLIGWAFQREDGSRITASEYLTAINTKSDDDLIRAGIYRLGQQVAADNKEVSSENNWDPLENTVYAVWQRKLPATFAKAGEQDISTKDPIALKDVEFAVYSDAACTQKIDSVFSQADGTVTFYFEETGTYYMKETTVPAGYLENTEVYTINVITIGETPEQDVYTISGNGGPNTVISGSQGSYQLLNKKERTTITLKKTDLNDNPLIGAEFELSMLNASGVYEKVSDISLTESNETSIENLVSGTYKLTETRAPDGYVITTDGTIFTVDAASDAAAVITLAAGSQKAETGGSRNEVLTIQNEPGVSLPSTGGPGTRIFTILGSILVLTAGILLWRRRRLI